MSSIMLFAEGLLSKQQVMDEFGVPKELESKLFAILKPKVGKLYWKEEAKSALAKILGSGNRPAFANDESPSDKEYSNMVAGNQLLEQRVNGPLLKTKQAADYLAIGERQLQYEVGRGNIRCVKFGKNCIRFAQDDLDEYVNRHRIARKSGGED